MSIVLFAPVLALLFACTAQDSDPKGTPPRAQPAPQAPADKPAQPVAGRATAVHPGGFELYSWRNEKGEWCFSLMEGTEHLKKREDVTLSRSAIVGVDAVKARLWKLADQETISWQLIAPKGLGPRFELPPKEVVDDLAKFAANYHLRLRVGATESEDAWKKQQEVAAAAKEPKKEGAPKRATAKATKGYELYSWLGDGETWRFALMPGTNRAKSHDEILADEVKPGGFDTLKAKLAMLAEGEIVTWRPIAAKDGAAPDAIPAEAQAALVDYCKSVKVDLQTGP